MTPSTLKFVSAAGLLTVWAALVFAGKADAGALVTTIQFGLAGLGFHSYKGNSQ